MFEGMKAGLVKFFPRLRSNTTLRRLINSTRVVAGIKRISKYRAINDCTIFDFCKLSEEMPLYTTEYFNQNTFFGNHLAIKRFAGIPRYCPVRGYIEHGLYFRHDIIRQDDETNGFRTNFTFSEYRKQRLMAAGIPAEKIIIVGPYILHVDSSMSQNEIESLHSSFGKTLAVFPAHSHEAMRIDFDHDAFQLEIEKVRLAHGFHKVLICLFFVDIQKGRYKPYEERGYTVVTAGHRHDERFLSRLKTIILLSDVTMSNGLGTHLGYCVALDRPHYFFRQETASSEPDGKVIDLVCFDEVKSKYLKEEWDVVRHFINYSETITPEQLEVVHKYWGPF